jgi:hypothetical protein
MSYQIVFQKDGRDIQTVYWNGSLEEARSLATQIANECEADAFQISEFTDAQVYSEKRPVQD